MTTTAMDKPASQAVVQTEPTWNGPLFRPNVDIVERAEELTILADMPGAGADGIDIQFENGTLSLYAKVRERQEEDTGYLLKEYGVGDFQRTFQVSETIDAERISAEYHDGVLVLHLPKTEAAKPRKIAVQTS